MKKLLVVVGIVALFGGLAVVSLVGRGCSTASQMADKTIFNADKHVWTYEEFRAKATAFEQNISLYRASVSGIKQLKTDDPNEYKTDPQYRLYVQQRTGTSQLARNIAAAYNKMAITAYQKVWIGKLPEKLEVPTDVI